MSAERPIVRLDRDDIVRGLRELVSELGRTGSSARIRLVGGAAIALAYNAARGSTVDLDAELTPETTILEAAHHVAVAFTWQEDWLNSAAVHFLPSGFGERTAEWSVLHEQNGIVVEVATAETLLAMKLFACQRRRRRELPDLRVLLPLCGIATIDDAEKHLGMYYPGEEFTLAAAAVVQAALDDPAIPQAAEPPVLA